MGLYDDGDNMISLRNPVTTFVPTTNVGGRPPTLFDARKRG